MSSVARLKTVMETQGYSQTQVARAVGRSGATINQYLNGKYQGDIEDITARVDAFVKRVEERQRLGRIYARFVATPLACQGLEAIAYAHQMGDICVMCGAAGLGKTMIQREYLSRNPDAIMIEADPGYTARTLLENLCGKLGISTSGTVHDLIDGCVKALKDSERIIMVDEAELLPFRALEVIRRIHDKTGVSVVLAGLPRLLINLKGKRGEFAQLYSRAGIYFNMGDRLQPDDFTPLATDMMPQAQDEKICTALYERARGNARRLFKLVRGVYRICDVSKTEVNVKAINRFSEMLIN